MTPTAILAHGIPHPPAGTARSARGRAVAEEPLQLAALVELPDLLRPADQPPADQHAGQGRQILPRDPLQLFQELPVHRQIPLIHVDAQPAEDRSDGPAVLVGPANHPQAREVERHGRLRRGERRPRAAGPCS